MAGSIRLARVAGSAEPIAPGNNPKTSATAIGAGPRWSGSIERERERARSGTGHPWFGLHHEHGRIGDAQAVSGVVRDDHRGGDGLVLLIRADDAYDSERTVLDPYGGSRSATRRPERRRGDSAEEDAASREHLVARD
ncbi:hypothetical protein AB1K54_14855 [Microbacterium sp. BWT-B31]|uniref:hypothetical protein n=1 Tax=Microbacterium sp. BWT-B31 TaxID=3232072 RepID=UPI0035287C2E